MEPLEDIVVTLPRVPTRINYKTKVPKLLQTWVRDLCAAGWSQNQIAIAIGAQHSRISSIYHGNANDVYFSVGYALMKLHEQVKRNQAEERLFRKGLIEKAPPLKAKRAAAEAKKAST